MKDYIKQQTEGFIKTHEGLVDDAKICITQLKDSRWYEMLLNIFAVLLLFIVWLICVFMYIGSLMFVFIVTVFDYLKSKIRELFNGR